MLKIGITGGIGSGKTALAREFQLLGVPVFDTDEIGRKLTQVGQHSFNKIIEHFGETVLLPTGDLDRKRLREIIFNNPIERQWLENILHPMILTEISDLAQQIEAPYIVAVIPLLIESQKQHYVDRILVIDVPEDIQFKRALARDKGTPEMIRRIMQSQVSRQERLSFADDLVDNSGDISNLAFRAKTLHNHYLSLSQKTVNK